MNQQPLIKCHELKRDYKMGEVTVHALRGLELCVNPGEFITLLGPSGSGKTTTLNLIGGLDKPTGGQVVVQGEEITRYNERQLADYRRRKVGFIFQFFNLIPTLNAAENIEFALRLTQKSGKSLDGRVHALLGLVGLADRANHFPAELSGGEQQRVAIARALANRPPLLLCDEPTGNLDVETGHQVLQVIRDLNQQEGTTVILVTHNTAIAPMSDRMIRLHDGMVSEDRLNERPLPVMELAW